jgi:hypothetical protein
LKKIGSDCVLEAADEMGLMQLSSATPDTAANPMAGLAQTGS